MGLSRDYRAASFFAVANVLAGLVHYAFQIWSGARLSAIDFGELNSWMAYFSVALSLGAFAQYFSNFFIAPQSVLTVLAGTGIGVSVFGLVLPFLVGEAFGWVAIGVVGVLLAIFLSWFVGQAQIRLLFYLMGTSVLIAAICKFAFALVPFPVEDFNKSLAWAVSLAYAPALAFACLAILYWVKEAPPVRGSSLGQSVLATMVLALASVYIPQFDIIVIHQTQTPEVIGQFARVSILYKAVFFSFLILAQFLLPYQVRSASPVPDGSAQRMGSGEKVGRQELMNQSSRRVRVLLMIVSLSIAAIVFAASDFILNWIWDDVGDLWSWVLLSCLNMALLTNIFFRIQVDCVFSQNKMAVFVILALFSEALIAMFLRPAVEEYFFYALFFNFAIWTIQSLVPRRAWRV